jgi:hypothetical protein
MNGLITSQELQANVIDFFKNHAVEYMHNTTLTPESLLQSYTSLDPLISGLGFASVFAFAHWILALLTSNYSQVGKNHF